MKRPSASLATGCLCYLTAPARVFVVWKSHSSGPVSTQHFFLFSFFCLSSSWTLLKRLGSFRLVRAALHNITPVTRTSSFFFLFSFFLSFLLGKQNRPERNQTRKWGIQKKKKRKWTKIINKEILGGGCSLLSPSANRGSQPIWLFWLVYKPSEVSNE